MLPDFVTHLLPWRTVWLTIEGSSEHDAQTGKLVARCDCVCVDMRTKTRNRKARRVATKVAIPANHAVATSATGGLARRSKLQQAMFQ